MESTINLMAVLIANSMGVIIMIIAIAEHGWKVSQNQRLSHILFYMSALTGFTCVMNVVCFFADGRPGDIWYYINYFSNCWLFLSNLVLGLSWINYLVHYMSLKMTRFHQIVLLIPSCVGSAFLVVNSFYPILFSLDESNVYHRGPFYYYYITVEALLLVDSIIMYCSARKNSGKLKTFPMTIFLIPILIGVVIQTRFYGVSTIWPFIAVSVCGLMFSLLTELLYRDQLTGIYNRYYLDTLKPKLQEEPENGFSILMVDLNGFKAINDRYGRRVGDEALIQTAERISSCVNTLGEVMRYASDEFLILLHTQEETIIQEVIDGIKENLDSLCISGENRYNLSVSVGYNKIDLTEHSLDELINMADKRMYENKRQYYKTHPHADRRSRRASDRQELVMSEEARAMVQKLERDTVTNAYTRSFFLEHVNQVLEDDLETSYDMFCIEVESYEFLLGRHGTIVCNTFMKAMTKTLLDILPEGSLIGRMEAGLLAVLIKHMSYDQHQKGFAEYMQQVASGPYPKLELKCGTYLNVDRSLSSEQIFKSAYVPIEEIRYDASVNLAEFDFHIQTKVANRQAMASSSENALKDRQFQVYYQPKFMASSGKISGAEALVRWTHPKLGFMNPGEFIPLFEHNGFIYKLDKYVLECVCADLRRWIDAGYKVVPISVNISQSDFDRNDLPEVLSSIVDKYRISHDLIHFEITESIDALDNNKKRTVIDGLRDKQFQIELDDFGKGFSTLNALGDLPIDILKIDQSLIRNIQNHKYKAILNATLFAANGLNLPVVVEGIETKEEAELLREMCEERLNLYMQGYYYSKPVPVTQFESMAY